MTSTVPVWIDDPTNAAILAGSEDRLTGFQLHPFGAIAERSGVEVWTVLDRVGRCCARARSVASTLEVPQGFSLEKHAGFLARTIGALSYRLMRRNHALDPEAMR